jgi:oligopeptidase B
LHEKTNNEVTAYLKAENHYAQTVMKPTAALQRKLAREISGRAKKADVSIPYRQGNSWYYLRFPKDRDYPIHCRKRGSQEAKEEVLLDQNKLAEGKPYFSLGVFVVSDDENRIAYTTDITGQEDFTMYVQDLRTGNLLPDRASKVSEVSWAADNHTLFFVTEDSSKRPYRLYRRALGGPTAELVYEEKDDRFTVSVQRSCDKKFFLATSASATTTEVRYWPANETAAAPRVILPREDGHQYTVDHRENRWYIRTNKDALEFRLVTAPLDDPRPTNWKELVPHRPGVLLENFDLFANHCVLSEWTNALQRRGVLDLRTNQIHYLEFPEPIYSLYEDNPNFQRVVFPDNSDYQTTVYRCGYQSLVTPDTVYEYDLNTRERKELKQLKLRAKYDPSMYTMERVFAQAADGARIPISLVYKKGVPRDGSHPLLLHGYGAYGISLLLDFVPDRLSLLDRGVICAFAHVRGGREMGEAWYVAGKLLNKRNSFTDFIAAADYLVAQKYTTRDSLVIHGGSAGGLLIAAVLNLRPNLCQAAVLEVPFVDVLYTMLDRSVPLTTQELLEWGDPTNRKEYDYMRSYCPYTNLAAKDYPAILVQASLNDGRVMYWESAKYVAKLRAVKTDHNMLLLKTNFTAGHDGASSAKDALKDTAFTYAFILHQMGITN